MRVLAFGAMCVVLGLAAGCASDESEATQTPAGEQTQAAEGSGQGATAVAELQPAAGKNVQGTITFEKVGGNQVKVMAHVTGLEPGKHGFHIHEKGDCSAPDFTSAGGHFNPTGAPHGAPDAAQHHAGDFGNLEANSQGEAHLETTVDFLEFDGANSFVGKAVIVHVQEDDLKTQPTGNAGGRLACGVIKAK